MMHCPYCLSAVQAEASVCKVCSREIHLFRALQDKVQALETQHLQKQHDSALTEQSLRRRISELERQLQLGRSGAVHGGWGPDVLALLQFTLVFVLLPGSLLVLGHALITVVYEWPLLWLRVWVFALPFVLAGLLERYSERWGMLEVVVAVAVMALLAVSGMSLTTATVDHVAVWPRDSLAWLEFLGYAAGIVVGHLCGRLAARWWRRRTQG